MHKYILNCYTVISLLESIIKQTTATMIIHEESKCLVTFSISVTYKSLALATAAKLFASAVA